MNNHAADMVEIFSSVQGEGLLVGLRQLFMRFRECNLECEYCDTATNIDPKFCAVEATPGRRDFIRMENPVTLEKVLALLDRWQKEWPAIHHSLSLTGGEPLLYREALAEWLPELRSRLPVYLESNGMLHCALESLIKHFDFISMDIKLPSTSGLPDMWDHHHAFLEVAAGSQVFVKTVVSAETEEWEISKACNLIASVDRKIPLILQPITLATGTVGIAPIRALELQELASSYLTEVRIIPQTHKFLGQL